MTVLNKARRFPLVALATLLLLASGTGCFLAGRLMLAAR